MIISNGPFTVLFNLDNKSTLSDSPLVLVAKNTIASKAHVVGVPVDHLGVYTDTSIKENMGSDPPLTGPNAGGCPNIAGKDPHHSDWKGGSPSMGNSRNKDWTSVTGKSEPCDHVCNNDLPGINPVTSKYCLSFEPGGNSGGGKSRISFNGNCSSASVLAGASNEN